MSVLYIIGNGFDLHHGLPTDLGDFRRYVHAVDRPIARAIADHLPADEDWSDPEASLAHLDPDELADALSVFLPGYGAEDRNDAGQHDFGLEVQRLTSAFSDGLVKCLNEWIRQVPRLSLDEALASGSLLSLQPGARFVTFNYAPPSLMCMPFQDQELGTCTAMRWIRQAISSSATAGDRIRSSTHRPGRRLVPRRSIKTGAKTVGSLTPGTTSKTTATYRNVKEVLARGADLLSQLWDVTEIYILGHSLADVDLPYFEAIDARIQPQASVWFRYHELEERQRHTASLIEAGFEDLALTPGTSGSLALR